MHEAFKSRVSVSKGSCIQALQARGASCSGARLSSAALLGWGVWAGAGPLSPWREVLQLQAPSPGGSSQGGGRGS